MQTLPRTPATGDCVHKTTTTFVDRFECRAVFAVVFVIVTVIGNFVVHKKAVADEPTVSPQKNGQLDRAGNPTEKTTAKPIEKSKAGSDCIRRSQYDVHYSLVYSTYEYRGETKKLRGDLYRPLTGDGPHPTVLLLHGGAWRTGSKVQMLLHAKKLAKRGYASLAISYRLAPRHPFPAQIHDSKAGVRWLRQNAEKYNLDAKRITAYGYSAGGHLACLLGTTDPSHGLEAAEGTKFDATISTRVQAVVGGGAPCDFRHIPPDANFLTFFLGGTRNEQPAKYRLASPASWVSPDDPPMFFFHGAEDWLVPVHNPRGMQERLKEVGVRTDMHVCEGKGHVNTYADDTSIQAAIDFLDSVFKPEPENETESTEPAANVLE